MKILYLGSFQENWSTENYVVNALSRAGCGVVKLEESTATHESIVAAAAEHEPQLFLFAKARFRGANQGWPEDAVPVAKMLEAIRPHVGKTVCWLFDLMAKEFSVPRFEWCRMVSAACDKFVLTDGYTAPQLPNSLVIRQGVPDDVDQDCLWNVEPRWDVLFLGTPYRERQLLVNALANRFGDRFRQVNDCRGKDLTNLVRSARICVGPQYPHFANYWSNRIYVITGHGGLFAAPAVSGMDSEGWKSGDNYLALPLAPEQMAAKLVEYVTRHDRNQLETIRRRGYEFANTYCTYDARVRQLLAALGFSDVDGPTESVLEEPTELDESTPEIPGLNVSDEESSEIMLQVEADPAAIPDSE